MSLTKSPQVSAAKQAANQSNARQSSGPATPPGKTRARLSNLKHGIYSGVSREVLEALGEDPSQLETFEAALLARFQPDGPFEEALVLKIARNFWRTDRCRRGQESTMIAEIERLEAERAEKAEDHGPKMQMVTEALTELLELTRRGDFSNRDRALAAYHRAYQVMQGANMAEIAALLARLWPNLQFSLPLQPAKDAGPPPAPPRDRPEAVARLLEVLEEEIESMDLYDQSHRQRQIEISPAKRESMMGPVQSYAPAMIRQEESLARQVERDVRLLYFLKSHDAVRNGAQGGTRNGDHDRAHEGGPKPAGPAPSTPAAAQAAIPESAVRSGADNMAGADAAPGSAAILAASLRAGLAAFRTTPDQADADAAPFAGSAVPRGFCDVFSTRRGGPPWPPSPSPLAVGGETPPLQFAQIGGETPPQMDRDPVAANPCRKPNLHIDPTMLMKTKDQILYPTMFMKNKPLSVGRRSAAGFCGVKQPAADRTCRGYSAFRIKPSESCLLDRALTPTPPRARMTFDFPGEGP